MNFKLEICVDSIESALNVQLAGADRIELCTNLSEGGTTPSLGTIVTVRDNLTIGLNVLIRPRGGDFLYSDPEFDIIRRDIELCGETGVDGIVIGLMRPDGGIDIERTAKLVELAHPMSVTFNRAFDMCSDPFQGLEDIIATGSSRVLTSGQKNKAPEGTYLLRELVKKAGSKIIIMPGSGLNEYNIAEIVKITGASEFHLTGSNFIDSEMIFRQNDITLGSVDGFSEFSRKVADSQTIINIIKILKMI